MIWRLSHRCSPVAAAIYDRHYSRRPSSVGFQNVVGPYRHLVFVAESALWVVTDQRPEFCKHAWKGAWYCAVFRNESAERSSALVLQAVAATVAAWGPLPLAGIVTHVDGGAVRKKRDPGRCFLRAGWRRVGETRSGLHVLRLSPCPQPEPVHALGGTLPLF